MAHEQVLSDLGERRIIEELLRPRYESLGSFGDDCAHITLGNTDNGLIVATTDPCPSPAAALAGFEDLYYHGWLLATINLSDIAAVGATPLGLLTSLILPPHTRVEEFVRLLDGIDECCEDSETHVVGGNLKEGRQIDLTATAIGLCADGPPMSRRGARPGDVLIAVGDVGLFWAGFASLRQQLRLPNEFESELTRNLLTPTPQIRAGKILASTRGVSSCLDNSDGLYPSLEVLGGASQVGFHLDFSDVTWAESVRWASAALHVPPERLALGWGDWQLLATLEPSSAAEVVSTLREANCAVTFLGHAVHEAGSFVREDSGLVPLPRVDSQRFLQSSWFTSGIDGYETLLLEANIGG